MKCCGINAIEAQISSEDGESIGEHIVSEAKEECAVDRGVTPPPRQQKKGSHGERNEGGEDIPRWPHENTSKLSSGRTKGGFKGFFSSVASLGGSKAGQADDGDDETKSERSQMSALSFLSNGLKKLTSKGENLLSLARGLSQKDGVSATFEPISLGDTGVTVIEHDQSYSTSASAALIVQGNREERCSLTDIVRFRAARRIQGQIRMRQARKAVIQHQASARAARLRWEEGRLQQRKREVDAKKRYKELCREEGEMFRRRRRVRKRLTTNLRSLERRRQKRKEHERYLAALAAIRGSGDSRKGQVKRRVWGRTEFTHSGWKPLYEAEDLSNIHDYVWKPPRGRTSGVRTYKVILPPRSEAERRVLTEDKNAWAGVLVGISRKPAPPERLGPPPRPGTMGATRAIPPSEDGEGWQMVAKYNWLPARLLSKAGLLQTPLKD